MQPDERIEFPVEVLHKEGETAEPPPPLEEPVEVFDLEETVEQLRQAVGMIAQVVPLAETERLKIKDLCERRLFHTEVKSL